MAQCGLQRSRYSKEESNISGNSFLKWINPEPVINITYLNPQDPAGHNSK